jgi:hypothetical protein
MQQTAACSPYRLRLTQCAPVSIAFHSGSTSIGKLVHRDGEGWKNFELDTSDLDGKSAELVAEITSSSRERRQYCFEADTR